MTQLKQRILLSLFDGTGSICRPFAKAGWLVRRLDVDGKHGADIVTNILDWNPAADWTGPPPDVIFAGPPCENYSTARTTAKTPRNLTLADSLVSKTLDVITHFHKLNPCLQYYVENPDSSMLWKRWVSHRLYDDISKHPMRTVIGALNNAAVTKTPINTARLTTRGFKLACKDKNAVRLDYCQYRKMYRKRTRLMTNNPFKGLMCTKNCPSVRQGRHIEVAQRGPRVFKKGSVTTLGKRYHTLDELHAYPEALVDVIYKHVKKSNFDERRRGVLSEHPEPELI